MNKTFVIHIISVPFTITSEFSYPPVVFFISTRICTNKKVSGNSTVCTTMHGISTPKVSQNKGSRSTRYLKFWSTPNKIYVKSTSVVFSR